LLSELPAAARLLAVTVEMIAVVAQFDGDLSRGLELVAGETGNTNCCRVNRRRGRAAIDARSLTCDHKKAEGSHKNRGKGNDKLVPLHDTKALWGNEGTAPLIPILCTNGDV
jgi:hypothetical protein